MVRGYPEWVGVMLAILLRSFIASPAAANIACNSPVDSYHDSRVYMSQPDFAVRGARSDIQHRGAPLCTGGEDTQTFAYAMLRGSYFATTPYAQIGYMQKNYGSVTERYFWEYDNAAGGGDFVRTVWGEPVRGDYHSFTATRYPSDGKTRLLLDGSLAPPKSDGTTAVTPWDMVSYSSTLGGEWASEAQDLGSDVPGSDLYRQHFRDTEQKKASDDQWYLRPVASMDLIQEGACVGGGYYYRSVRFGNYAFYNWTDPPDHVC